MGVTPHTGPTDAPRAAAWMAGTVVSFSLMAVAGRAASIELDTFEIMTYRSVFGLVAVVAVGAACGTLRQVTLRSPGLHLARNLGHFAGQNLWFLALTMIPLAEVFALEFTTPLWVLMLSPLILGERMTRSRAFAAAAGFAGILLATRPGAEALDAGTLVAAAAAIGFALSIIFTRRLTRTETLTCILFWMTLLQTVFGLVCAGFDGDIALPTARTFPWLALIGMCGLCAHFCYTKALTLAPATVASPVDFLRLPLIAVVGFLFYSEPLDPFVLAGAAIIFGANYANILAETRRARQEG